MAATLHIPTGEVPAHHQPATSPEFPARLQQLRIESGRLRFEFLRTALDFNLTVASFSTIRPENPKLRESCGRTARKGYHLALSMMSNPRFGGLEKASELLPKLLQLRDAIERFDSVDLTPVPAPALTPPVRVDGSGPSRDGLTPREIDVLKCIAQGYSTKEIAHNLGMSFKTAACHRYRIMDKLGIHDVVNLLRYAVRAGLVEL
jgi:DNA-binding CsgD family transcriptional regulator